MFLLRRDCLVDWKDAEALRILQNCRTAITPDGKAFVVNAYDHTVRPRTTHLALLPLGNTQSLQDMPLLLRLLVSVHGLLFYLQKTLLPLYLSPLYPLSFQVTWIQLGMLIAGAGFAWACRRRWPAFTAAALVYVVTVAPVIGIFQNGPQAAADRYTYLACLGWALLAGGALARWWPQRRILAPVAAAWLAALAFLTWQQTSLWRDPISLWSQAAVVSPCTGAQCSAGSGGVSRRYHSASRAAWQPEPAAVTAWR